MSFDGEDYEANRIIRQCLDIEEHCIDGSAVLQGCSCIQDRHLQALASAGEQYSAISQKDENKEFGRKVAVWADEALKTVYAFHQSTPNESKNYEAKAWSFYKALAANVRAIRTAFEANEKFPINDNASGHKIKCGCKGCPPCTS